jgi:hypothetical protein
MVLEPNRLLLLTILSAQISEVFQGPKEFVFRVSSGVWVELAFSYLKKLIIVKDFDLHSVW